MLRKVIVALKEILIGEEWKKIEVTGWKGWDENFSPGVLSDSLSPVEIILDKEFFEKNLELSNSLKIYLEEKWEWTRNEPNEIFLKEKNIFKIKIIYLPSDLKELIIEESLLINIEWDPSFNFNDLNRLERFIFCPSSITVSRHWDTDGKVVAKSHYYRDELIKTQKIFFEDLINKLPNNVSEICLKKIFFTIDLTKFEKFLDLKKFKIEFIWDEKGFIVGNSLDFLLERHYEKNQYMFLERAELSPRLLLNTKIDNLMRGGFQSFLDSNISRRINNFGHSIMFPESKSEETTTFVKFIGNHSDKDIFKFFLFLQDESTNFKDEFDKNFDSSFAEYNFEKFASDLHEFVILNLAEIIPNSLAKSKDLIIEEIKKEFDIWSFFPKIVEVFRKMEKKDNKSVKILEKNKQKTVFFQELKNNFFSTNYEKILVIFSSRIDQIESNYTSQEQSLSFLLSTDDLKLEKKEFNEYAKKIRDNVENLSKSQEEVEEELSKMKMGVIASIMLFILLFSWNITNFFRDKRKITKKD